MKKSLRTALFIILLPILWVVCNLIYGTMTDYQPPKEETVAIRATHAQRPDSIVRLIDWNVGYCGLGEESDFFYDGGKTVRMKEETVRKNLDGVLSFVKNNDSVDVFLLQEVDTLSKRSWQFNEYNELRSMLPHFNASFTLNYNVRFVPIPFTEPMGKVMGGLASFNRFTVTNAMRYQFPSSYAWPNRIYFLDRCFMVQRMPYNDVELVIINTHNSAYDDGSLKKAEMDFLKDFLITEEEKGNYVIVGGDWNQHAPGTGDRAVPQDFLDGWTWAFDTSYPTNRNLEKAYVAGETQTQVIDFYLCSPNISVEAVKVINLDFKFSDHQPVYLRAKLKG
ncbi:MAG: endonuclease/exonuclease/phosphatase family protein [Flavobacteriales bacterium]|nr:endonuclease/exonuclease/phosphatase family protein [Flavobacteriales bacterium]